MEENKEVFMVPDWKKEFARCVKTWTGCKYESGSVSGTVTTGLSYLSQVPPAVGKYYTQDGLIECKVYAQTGLIFYAPLATIETETGQTLTANGTVGYTAENNVPCASLGGSSALYSADGVPGLTGNVPYAISLYGKYTGSAPGGSVYNQYLNFGGDDVLLGAPAVMVNPAGYIAAGSWGNDAVSDVSALGTGWHHIVSTYTGSGTIDLYVDGVYKGTTPFAPNLASGRLVIGSKINMVSWYFQGYIAEVKVYNRALSVSEIASEYQRLQSMTSV